jgi:hypothetical protein
MVCGTPVVAFNRSASQESLHPMASRLLDVSADSIAEVADVITQALADPARSLNWTSEGMSVASRDSYALFAPHVQAKAMLRALRKIRINSQPLR